MQSRSPFRAGARGSCVRYEDLVSVPSTKRRIVDALGLWLDDLLDKPARDKPLATGHNVGSNHIRPDREVTFRLEKTSAHDLPF